MVTLMHLVTLTLTGSERGSWTPRETRTEMSRERRTHWGKSRRSAIAKLTETSREILMLTG
jgi:hypothetical protein